MNTKRLNHKQANLKHRHQHDGGTLCANELVEANSGAMSMEIPPKLHRILRHKNTDGTFGGSIVIEFHCNTARFISTIPIVHQDGPAVLYPKAC